MNNLTRIALLTLLTLPAFALAQQYEFTPLTNLPGLSTVSNADTLPNFFNNLYRLCIGAAAVIAILQIMRAGVQYFMFNKGSVAHNEKGKALIGNALLGLLLVLSPAIVFSIINPDILNLKLDVGALQPPADPTAAVSVFVKSNATEPIDQGDFASTEDWQRAQALQSACVARGGTVRIGVYNTPTRCPADPENTTNCRAGTVRCELANILVDPAIRASCVAAFEDINAVPATQQCPVGSTETQYSCCQGAAPGTRCCGKPRGVQPVSSTTPTTQPTTPQTPAANQYLLRAYFQPPGGGGFYTLSRGPFNTQLECQNEFNAFVNDHQDDDPQPLDFVRSDCDCSAPRSSFQACRL